MRAVEEAATGSYLVKVASDRGEDGAIVKGEEGLLLVVYGEQQIVVGGWRKHNELLDAERWLLGGGDNVALPFRKENSDCSCQGGRKRSYLPSLKQKKLRLPAMVSLKLWLSTLTCSYCLGTRMSCQW
ncbi:hypothetical protein OIU74_015173 [Salix koriyanagi]|uniref:Uncharacterized protein n=1 Tax=Salix koriyanagi TaxID=2511006 RepID=A0A9Q0PXE4_9ROSI|nr:hypothetical protein OIU74_015173 [Salix koriyanagi]